MKIILHKIGLILIVLCLASCLKLDSNLFNNRQDIDTYRFDLYRGEQDFILDSKYHIDSVYLFDLWSKTSDETHSTKIKACYLGKITQLKTDTVILYCHGNKWHMDFYWQRAKLLAHCNKIRPYPVLFFDYRGYGLSEGIPSENGMYADTRACLQWLKNNGLSSDRLIIYGFSLGSAPATEITAHSNENPINPCKIILEAPFASASVMAQDGSCLNFSSSFFTNLKIDNAEEIKNIHIPLLWLHGTMDMFLNYKTHGWVVYKNKTDKKDSVLINNADHGEIPVKMGFENYINTINRFIGQ